MGEQMKVGICMREIYDLINFRNVYGRGLNLENKHLLDYVG